MSRSGKYVMVQPHSPVRDIISSDAVSVDALAAGADPDDVWVADVTSPDLVCAEPEATIADVAERMTVEGIRHMTIIERGVVVGVVSVRDALAVLSSYVRASLQT